jgi:ABC-type phosphate transport system substrate-binding protein
MITKRACFRVAAAIGLAISPLAVSVPPAAASALAGGGSSFAGIEMQQWTDDVSSLVPPISISYTPSSSGQGRSYFNSGTVPFAVSDIPYQGEQNSDPAPSFPFEYIPAVAGGLSFMYNLPGNPVLKLTAALACGIFTGEITNWDDPALATLNPGLPNLAIVPVLRGDLAGTNYVFESWCITDAPQEWQSFYNYVSAHGSQFANSDSPPIGVTSASSAFPQMPGTQTGTGDSGTAQIVGAPDNSGYITYVEPEYAKTYGNKPVAFVENASGDFTQPTPENVAGALAYAAGETNGIQQLNFGGTGCNVYNPSTYSYVLARTDGSYGSSYGQTLGGFLNYVLTIGEKQASSIDYASIGLALEQFGIQQAQNIPGDPGLTSTEQANFAAGDVTPSIVQNTPCGQQFQLAAPPATTTTQAATTTTQAATTTTQAATTTTAATTSTTAATTGTTASTTPTTAGATPTTSRATTATTSRGSTATTSAARTATTSRGSTATTTASNATVPPTTAAASSGTPPATGTSTGSATTVTTPGRPTPIVTVPSKATGPDHSHSGGATSPTVTSPNGSVGVTTGTVATRGAGASTPPTSAGAPSGPSDTRAVATTSASGPGVTAPLGAVSPSVTVAGGTSSPSVVTTGGAVSASVTVPGGTPSASTGGQQVYIVLVGLGIAGAAEIVRRGIRRKALGAR